MARNCLPGMREIGRTRQSKKTTGRTSVSFIFCLPFVLSGVGPCVGRRRASASLYSAALSSPACYVRTLALFVLPSTIIALRRVADDVPDPNICL
jgi:hypothetical protein